MLSDLIKAAGRQQKLEGIYGMTFARRIRASPGSPAHPRHVNAAAAHLRPALPDPELLRQPPLAYVVTARDKP